MQASSGGEGGGKWKPEGGGNIVRAAWENMALDKRIAPNPKADALIAVGIMLRDRNEVVLAVRGMELVVKRMPIQGHAAEDVIFGVTLAGQIVFDAAYIAGDLVYGAFVEGEWLETVMEYMERLRVRSRKAQPAPVGARV